MPIIPQTISSLDVSSSVSGQEKNPPTGGAGRVSGSVGLIGPDQVHGSPDIRISNIPFSIGFTHPNDSNWHQMVQSLYRTHQCVADILQSL
jgi:hypothetical protein